MEVDYKKLLQRILPKITYNYPSPGGISYDIIYENVLVTQKTISLKVDYERTTPHNKLIIVKKVLDEVLYNEIRNIDKYINLQDKSIIIECDNIEEKLI